MADEKSETRKAANSATRLSKRLAPDRFAHVASDLLRQGLGVRFCATGRSMQPTIWEGEPITVEPVSCESVRRGDIILCQIETALIAHRVERVVLRNGRPLEFILRGDAALQCDQPVAPDQVLGRVVRVERDGHEVSLAARCLLFACPVGIQLRRLKMQLSRWIKGATPSTVDPARKDS